MAKKKYIDYKKQQQELFIRTEGYAAEVRSIYQKSLGSIINLVKGTELENGKPFSFSDYGYNEDVTPILREMYSKVYQVIRGGSQKEWIISNENNDGLVKSVFGEHSIEDHHFARYFQRNMAAMDAFLSRKTNGLNLSQKVWNYTGQFKEELENALDLAIGEGIPANRLATQIQKYLNEPDRFYRRFRVKIGEDDDGKPVYGRVWKRRIWSEEDQSYRWINDNPKDYHPGPGVYRSSFKNAQRLARTETNIAYRMADSERWQQLDFVIGYEIKRSNNFYPCVICEELKGIYPKWFKWCGWHPNCRCYMVPVLAKEKELDQMLDNILNGDDPGKVECQGNVDELPVDMKKYIRDNRERYEKAKANGTLPYWCKDNQERIDNFLYGLTPEQKKAAAMGDLLVDPLEILKRFGMAEMEKLYAAVQSKLGVMLKGELSTQKSNLEFEISWVTDHKKYATWKEAADAYKKALDDVNRKLEKQSVLSLSKNIEQFLVNHPKSKKVKSLYEQIKQALDDDNFTDAKSLIAQANAEIQKYEKAKIKKLSKSSTELEKYCDDHRTYDPQVDNKTFRQFQDRSIAEVSDAWINSSYDAKKAVSGYTDGTYDYINASYWRDKKGCAEGKLMDEILDKCFLSEDTVLRRGCSFAEMRSIFGNVFGDLLDSMNIDGLNKMVGSRGINEGFISTSWDMEGGFWKSVDLKLFAPKGTQAFYAKPVSGFGDGHGDSWDGKDAHLFFRQGRENETIVHRGYEYRFIRAEKTDKNGSRITIYVDLLTREKRTVK